MEIGIALVVGENENDVRFDRPGFRPCHRRAGSQQHRTEKEDVQFHGVRPVGWNVPTNHASKVAYSFAGWELKNGDYLPPGLVL